MQTTEEKGEKKNEDDEAKPSPAQPRISGKGGEGRGDQGATNLARLGISGFRLVKIISEWLKVRETRGRGRGQG
jgi:hypothetical protein